MLRPRPATNRALLLTLLAGLAIGGLTVTRGVATQPVASSSVIIGVNDGSGWGTGPGTGPAGVLLSKGITSDRIEMGSTPPFSQSESYGFRNDTVIVGNVDDATPLNKVDLNSWLTSTEAQVDSLPTGTLMEVGNEMYLKGNGYQKGSPYPDNYADPVTYAKMYSALATARPNAALNFVSFGNYQRADGSWSNDEDGNGWLADALRAVPALKNQIKGFVAHPYGTIVPLQNGFNSYGPGALVAQHDYAVQLGLPNADKWYLTEFGVNLQDLTATPTASVLDQQASRLTQAYNFFLGLPYVRGIWWYQSHDDGTGRWGLFNNDNTTRPSLDALAAFAQAQTKSTPSTTPAPTSTPAATPKPTATSTSTPKPTSTATPRPTPSPSSNPSTLGKVPAFPNPPKVTSDGNGGLLISGSGDTSWHVAFSKNSTSGASAYSYPDPLSNVTDYKPPSSTPCVSILAMKGGTGRDDGAPGNGWSPWVCATAMPPAPAFPNPPAVTSDGHGGLLIRGSGDTSWHIAYSKSATAGASTYSYPDPLSSVTDYKPPSSTPCVSILAMKGGTGHDDGTSGNGWSQWVCAS